MILQVSSLSFSYSRTPILRDVTFSLERGRICVLLGANGAGKSTLIKCLAGILRFDGGSIVLDGKDSRDYKSSEYASRIAYVPQNPTFESMTVLDTVLIGRLPLFRAPGRGDYRAAADALDKVGISELALKDASRLSGGEKQKVAIARALATGAELILMDEPISDLDIRSRYLVLDIIARLAKEGKTLILSMHDLNDALDVGDDFVVLRNGEIVAAGDHSVLDEGILFDVFGIRLRRVEEAGKPHFYIDK